MAEWVCCPKCWKWSPSGKASVCRRCGTALIRDDGRRVDGAAPPPPPVRWAYQASGLAASEAQPPPLFPPIAPAFASRLAPPGLNEQQTDWVGIARWITIGYGALVVIFILGFGLLVRHISIQTTDPITGFPAVQTVDIGPTFVVVAIMVATLFGAFAWLTQFTIARVAFLLIDGVAFISAIANVFDRPLSFVGLGIASIAIDLAWGYVLVMSLISGPARNH